MHYSAEGFGVLQAFPSGPGQIACGGPGSETSVSFRNFAF